MKFKQSIKSIFVILLTLFVGANYSFGQIPIDGIDPENPATWFYVNLTAQPSTPACGANPGQVWLHSVTPSGEDSNPYVLPAKPANPYDEENQFTEYNHWNDGFNEGKYGCENGQGREDYPDWYCTNNDKSLGFMDKRGEGWYAGWDWYNSGHYLNPENPIGFAASASLKGYTVVYAPGFEDLMGFSSYASFYGKAQENDGWYFIGWSFTDGDNDLGVGDENGTLFRILPAATAGEANIRNEYVYATFKPVLVSDYKVNGLINTSVSNSTTVVFDAVGERVSTADFTVSSPEANFTAEITSCENNKVIVTVTYSGDANGEFRGNVTLASKSGCSQLTAPVYARVGDDATNEATLYDGKTPTSKSGTLIDMIDEADGKDLIVMLNKNYEKDLTIKANVTLNLNGYTIKNLTVTGGKVTIAYDKYGSNGEAISVKGGRLILDGGEFASMNISAGASVEQNGATITGTATNNGTLVTTEGRFEVGLSSLGTLTVNGGAFEGETAITVNGGTAIFNKATVSGATTGILVEGGETTISSKLVSVYGGTNAVKQTSGTVNLLNGKFAGETAPLAGTINLQSGYFKTNTLGIDIPSGKKVLNVLAGTEFAEGYRYFIGDDASTIGVCRIGTTSYATLEDALAYANNNPSQDVVIIMTNDYTLPAGYYTLPTRAMLIVPMSDEQETGYELVNRVSNNSAAPTSYVQPFEFRRLTFAEGVNMDVYGTIELSGTQRASDDGYAAMPHGAYGHLVMEAGSHMTLQNGSLLRAWGFMTGKGETDARRGSKVREQFQMGDWKGGSISFSMLADDRHVFPITQYFIQNVESPVKYHPGALLSTTTSVSANFGSMGITAMANDIVIVGVSGGDPAMFFMDQEADAENTWVRKWYDAEHDVQTYDVNSGAHIGSMVLDLGKLGTSPLVMNSATFVLPITNNMKIHLLYGQMDFTQTTALLPGAEVEVDKESTVTIYANNDDLSTLSSFESQYKTWVDGGQQGDAPEKPILSTGELFVYDADEWDNYAKGKGDTGKKYTKVVKYSPSWDGALISGKPADGKPDVRSETTKPGDATINVHGTFDTGQGAVYTTAGGANIFSSNEDAGSFIVQRPTPSYTAKIYQVKNASASSYESTDAVSAKLKNGTGAAEAYTATAGTGTNLAFLYRDNAWQAPVKDNIQTFYFDCYTAEVDMNAYAADVMAKMNNIAIYHAPDNIAECLVGMAMAQTQGMSLTPANYETMKANGLLSNYMATIQEQVASMKEAGYDLGGAVQHIYIKPQEWLEIAATAHIKLDFDEDYIEELEASYNPDNYNDAVNAYMDYVKARAYNPILKGVEGNSDHTYSDADGAGRLFILTSGCQWWEVEKKDNLYHCIHPNNDTYYYWDDVEEDWKEQRFIITWKNWDGTIIETTDMDGNPTPEYSVTYGTMAEFLGTNPTREPDIDYTYDFTGWSPELGPVTSNVTYTATYEKKERKYTITFLQEGGVEIERQFLPHNAVPVCENTPTKIGHTLVWSPAIAAVTGDATYTATWEEEPPTKYEVTFYDYDGTTPLQQSDVNVGDMPTFSGSTPTGKPATSEFTYVFDHWSPEPEVVSATSVKSYVAVYREVPKTYTIKFLNEDNSEIESHEYMYGETPVCSATPTKEPTAQFTYTFAWTPQIETVRGDATYTARFTRETNKYTVTLKANPSGACTFTGAGTFDYNTTVNNVTVSYDEEQYEFKGWSDLTGDAKMATTHAAFNLTEDITIVADFRYKGDDKVTITWKNWNGGDLGTSEPKVNAATTFIGATPTREASESKTYTFYGWYTKNDKGDTLNIYKNGLTPKATAPATYYAYFTESLNKYKVTLLSNNSDVCTLFGAGTYEYGTTAHIFAKVRDGYEFVKWEWAETHTTKADLGDVEVQGDITYKAVVREAVVDKKVGIKSTYAVADGDIVKDLILESNGNASGQITNATALTVEGNAYFDLSLNADAQTWYAFGLPWQVNTNGGMTAAGQRLAIGQNCFILEYDGAAQAAGTVDPQTGSYWHYVANGATLQPAKLYMIYLRDAAPTIRFAKAVGAKLVNTTITLDENPSASTESAGWNAIANPTTSYTQLTNTVFPDKGQVYVPGKPDANGNNGDRYDAITLASNQLIVGQPLFVQVEVDEDKKVETNASNIFAAPRRAPQASAEYEVRIAPVYADFTDRLYISASDDKEDKYIIGQDLSKISVATGVAQMWINRYDTKLCANVTEVMNDQAVFPMGIYAPKDGQYTLSTVSTIADNEELYVTIDGTPVWDLSAGVYTIDLQKGNTSEYGLVIVRRPAPEVTTGCQNVEASENASVRKVLINGQVFILRDGAVYTIFGQKAK